LSFYPRGLSARSRCRRPFDWLLRTATSLSERLLQDERVVPSACNNLAVRWAALYGHLAVRTTAGRRARRSVGRRQLRCPTSCL
jgi:hypothetical protein